MSDLIDKTAQDETRYDSECPECGSDNVWRSAWCDLDELESVSPWCDDCGHGWMESL